MKMERELRRRRKGRDGGKDRAREGQSVFWTEEEKIFLTTWPVAEQVNSSELYSKRQLNFFFLQHLLIKSPTSVLISLF